MAHPRARLTPFGRRLLVERIEALGWTAAEAARSTGVSRSTASKWVKRFREEGTAGLEDRSSRPHRSPHRLSRRDERQILRARRRSNTGPHHLAAVLGRPRSTVYAVLRRHGMNRLVHADRPPECPSVTAGIVPGSSSIWT